MTFIKVGEVRFNLNRVMEIVTCSDESIMVNYGTVDSEGTEVNSLGYGPEHTSYKAFKCWLGHDMPIPETAKACLDIDVWYHENIKGR